MRVDGRDDFGNVFIILRVSFVLNAFAGVHRVLRRDRRRVGVADAHAVTAYPIGAVRAVRQLGQVADNRDCLADRNDRARLGLRVQHAGFLGFNFDVTFVGLDLGDHVAELHRFPILLLPFQQGAFFHRVTHLGHDHFSHSFLYFYKRPSARAQQAAPLHRVGTVGALLAAPSPNWVSYLFGVNVLRQLFNRADRAAVGEFTGGAGHI